MGDLTERKLELEIENVRAALSGISGSKIITANSKVDYEIDFLERFKMIDSAINSPTALKVANNSN